MRVALCSAVNGLAVVFLLYDAVRAAQAHRARVVAVACTSLLIHRASPGDAYSRQAAMWRRLAAALLLGAGGRGAAFCAFARKGLRAESDAPGL